MKEDFTSCENSEYLAKVIEVSKAAEDLIMIDYGDGTFDMISRFKLKPKVPNRRELRLALEIIDQHYPLYKKADAETKADFVRDVFKFDVPTEKVTNLKSFKKILFKTVIVSVTEHNGKYIVKHKKVRR